MGRANLAAQPFDPATFEPVDVWLAEVGCTCSAADVASAQYRLQQASRAAA